MSIQISSFFRGYGHDRKYKFCCYTINTIVKGNENILQSLYCETLSYTFGRFCSRFLKWGWGCRWMGNTQIHKKWFKHKSFYINPTNICLHIPLYECVRKWGFQDWVMIHNVTLDLVHQNPKSMKNGLTTNVFILIYKAHVYIIQSKRFVQIRFCALSNKWNG